MPQNKPKILIVDDLVSNLDALAKLLKSIDCQTITANSGNQALVEALKHEFALFIIDVQMPAMDGYEVAQLLRENESSLQTPIILVTAAYKDEQHQLLGYDSGAVDYIEKPIQDKVLLSKVAVFLELWRKQQELAQAVRLLEQQKTELEWQIILRKEANEQSEYRATHDPLTGLANRSLLNAQITSSLANAKRNNKQLALLFIDLDSFKPINDQHSHEAGDYVLQTTAEKLLHCVRVMDTVARYGGDEFIVLLPDLECQEQALELAGRILTKLAEPFTWQERRLKITASIGIAIYPDLVSTADMLIMGADNAMYEAKARGKNKVILFSA